MAAKTKASTAIDPKLEIRLLLSLWDLGGMEKEVKQSELTNRVKLSKESNSTYQKVYDELEKKGAIAVSKKGRSVNVSLTPQGLEILKSGLISADFQYRPQQRVRTKDFNALLNWIKHLESSVPASAAAEKVELPPAQISSLEEFKKLALEVYERLNRDYNLDNLVPIYRIRREIGDRVSRTQFNEWLLEMQAIDLIQLIGGEVTDITPDRAEDSITTKLGALRYYVQRLNA